MASSDFSCSIFQKLDLACFSRFHCFIHWSIREAESSAWISSRRRGSKLAVIVNDEKILVVLRVLSRGRCPCGDPRISLHHCFIRNSFCSVKSHVRTLLRSVKEAFHDPAGVISDGPHPNASAALLCLNNQAEYRARVLNEISIHYQSIEKKKMNLILRASLLGGFPKFPTST